MRTRGEKTTGNQFCCKRGRRIKCGFSQCVRSCRSVCPVRRNLCTPFGDIYTRCGVVVRAPSKFILLYHRLDELNAHHQPKRRPWSYTRARIRIRPSTRKTDQPWGGDLAEEQNAIRLIARQIYLNWKRAYNVSQCTRYVLFSIYSGHTFRMDSLNRAGWRECARDKTWFRIRWGEHEAKVEYAI